MKRRSLTLVLCLLATLSLASVGFAAWVISAGDTENLTGNISVETITDQRLLIEDITVDGIAYDLSTKTWTGGKAPEFVFGKPQDGEAVWLKNDTVQKLELVVTFKLYENKKDNAKPEGVKTEITNVNIGTIKITNAFSAVIASAGAGKTFAKVVEDAPTAEYVDGKWQFSIELDWGNYFGAIGDVVGVDGTNPFTYYNGLDFTDENANDAFTKLDAMYNAMEEATFTVQIKADFQ